jgi:hypothetical protein
MSYIPLPGQTNLSLLVEGGEAYGPLRINRRLDARWRRVAERLLQGVTPAGSSYLILTGVSSDGEQFDINGRRYELDPATPPVIAATSDVGITVANGANAIVTAAAIVVQVNADADRDVDAIVMVTAGGADRIVAFVPRVAMGDVVGDGAAAGYAVDATGTTVPMVNGAFGTNRAVAALFDGDGNPAAFNQCSGTHVVTANDFTRFAANDGVPIASVPFTSAPVRVQYSCMTGGPTVTGSVIKSLATVEFVWRQVNASRWVLECVDLVPVLVAGDFIHWTVSS